MLAQLVLTVLVLAFVYWRSRRWNLDRKTANIPTLPGELPLLGHLHLLNGDASTLWSFLANAGYTTNSLGGISKMWLGPFLYFIVTDPDLHKEIQSVILDKSSEYKFMKNWMEHGLVTADVPIWKRHRKLLSPTFNLHNMLNGFLNVMNNEADNLVKCLQVKVGKGEFDVFPFTNDSSLNTVIKTAIALDQPSDFIREYGRMVEIMFNILRIRFQNLWMTFDFLYYWTKTKKREDEAVKNLIKMSTDVIDRKRASFNEVNSDNNNSKTFLDVFLKLEADGSLSQQEIREEVDTIITAGSDTTATAMVYTLVMLGSYPEVQDKVYHEVVEVLGNVIRDVTKEDISQLVYTEAVIKEVLRMHSPVPILGRSILRRDLKIGNYTIPKDSTVFINTNGMHMGASWGDDAELFRPERWLTPGGVPDLTSCYAPFGSGRRACLGKVYAMMSMKVTLAHLIRRYRVKADRTKLKSQWNTLMKPASGSEICIEFR